VEDHDEPRHIIGEEMAAAAEADRRRSERGEGGQSPLPATALDIARMLDADAYQPDDPSIASDLPGVWLRHAGAAAGGSGITDEGESFFICPADIEISPRSLGPAHSVAPPTRPRQEALGRRCALTQPIPFDHRQRLADRCDDLGRRGHRQVQTDRRRLGQ
jgi:hypothetical protein